MTAKLLTFTAYNDHNVPFSPLMTGKVTQEKRSYVTVEVNGSKVLVGTDVFLTLCDVKTSIEDGATIPTHLSRETNFRKLTDDIWVVSFHEPVDEDMEEL